jgi:hypothetical protein
MRVRPALQRFSLFASFRLNCLRNLLPTHTGQLSVVPVHSVIPRFKAVACGLQGKRSEVKGYAEFGGSLNSKSIYRMLFIDFGQILTKSTFLYSGTAGRQYREVRGCAGSSQSGQ